MAGELALVIPPLTTPGPAYAAQINEDLEAIQSHSHDGVDAGASIDISKQVCTQDLSVQGNNVTNVRSVELNNNPAALTGSQDVNCLYVNQNNLGFNNDEGIFIPITDGNTLAITTFPLTNFTPRSSTITADFSILATDTYNLINIDCSGGSVTGTLPIAASILPSAPGRLFIFHRVGINSSNTVTIQVAVGSGNSFGTSIPGTVSFTLPADNAYAAIYTDGISKWYFWTQNEFGPGEHLTFSGGAQVLFNASPIIMANGSTIIQDSTSLIETFGAMIVSSGNFTCNGTTTMNVSDSTTCSWNSGTSCTFQGGSTCTFASGSELNLAGDVQVTGTVEITGGSVTTDATITIQGSANTLLGSLSIVGGSVSGSSGASISFDKSTTITDAGQINFASICGRVTMLNPGSYTVDSGAAYDYFIGLVLAASGTWNITFPSNPSTGRIITIGDGNGFPTTSSPTYTINLLGNGRVFGNNVAAGGTVSTYSIYGGDHTTAWWSVSFIYLGNGNWSPYINSPQ